MSTTTNTTNTSANMSNEKLKKFRMRPVKSGKSTRMSYSNKKEVLEMPNLIDVQVNSYQWFLTDGLDEAFRDISPIRDFSGNLVLEFLSHRLDYEKIKYTIEECKERDATYAAPLKVVVQLRNNKTNEIDKQEVFMGDLPLMTETGTFVINGAERVIVSQLVRSPGIYYDMARDKTGKPLYSCTVIPNRGAWLEYETDANDVFWVRVDRNRKVPITVLLRALDGDLGTNDQILEKFGEEQKLIASFEKDPATTHEEGLLELYKKLKPGEPLAVETADTAVKSMFFDVKRYDLAKVGRYKFNKKLALQNRVDKFLLAEDVYDLQGNLMYSTGEFLNRKSGRLIQNAGVPYVVVKTEERNIRILSNLMVDLRPWIKDLLPGVTPEELGITEDVYFPELCRILREVGILAATDEDKRDEKIEFAKTELDAEEQEALKNVLKENVSTLIPKWLSFDAQNLTGTVNALPTREDIDLQVQENMIVEFYSR